MPMPKSVTKFSKKDGVTFVSSVDRVNYTIDELTRAALKDVGRIMRLKLFAELKTLPGMNKQIRKGGRINNSTQYWARPRDKDLQIGFKHDTWYGVHQELGTKNQPARHILRDTVYENIPLIVKIESQYLSALEDEARALSLIDESEEVGDE